MAVFRCCAVGLAWLLVAAGPDSRVALREAARVGETARVRISLKAEGQYQPPGAPNAANDPAKKAEKPKPLALKVESRLDFAERVAKADPQGRPIRVWRRVLQAASAINGEIRPMGAILRPEVALLVAETRNGSVAVFSPGGPLTRSELEVVQGAGDPLALADLLPAKPVAVGDKWRVGPEAARALSSYDALSSNALDARLESIDDASARFKLKGEIRGAALGGEGTIACDGSFTFDRKANRIDRLTLDRAEVRKPGPVEAGLDIKSTLILERRSVETPAELTDDALSGVANDPEPRLELLLFVAPNHKYTLLHDRDWHLFWDDNRQTVLKRLDHGEVVAQGNLVMGPVAGKGRHQDLGQFRDDVRRALGKRFIQFLGVGEVEGDPAGGFRYKVGVQGHEGELGVLWNYFLVASAEGDQLLATFTLAEAQSKAFGDQDLQLIGSLRWTNNDEEAAKP